MDDYNEPRRLRRPGQRAESAASAPAGGSMPGFVSAKLLVRDGRSIAAAALKALLQ